MEVNLLHHGYNVERRKMYPANRISVYIQLGTILSVLLILYGKSLWRRNRSIPTTCRRSRKNTRRRRSTIPTTGPSIPSLKGRGLSTEAPSGSCPSIPLKTNQPGANCRIPSATRWVLSRRGGRPNLSGRKADILVRWHVTTSSTSNTGRTNLSRTAPACPQLFLGTTSITIISRKRVILVNWWVTGWNHISAKL